MFMYKVAEPNEALIISGLRAHSGAAGDAAGLGFKIVVGKGAFTMPGLQKVRRLSLDIHEAELDLQCVTTQGIPVGVKAVVIYKIADDFQSIANAARRFLDQEEQMDVKVHNVFAGHLRSIVGSMTVEDLIRNREKLTQATRDSSAGEMQKLGLTIDSLQIQEIEDKTGYIDNLSAPEASRVAKEARIAQAASDREATEREQEAEAQKAAARSQSQIRQAEVAAQANTAQAQAEQAGPRAAATARQVELRAAANAQKVKVGAEATAESTRKVGEAEGAALQARGAGEGEAVKAKGLAEAEAIRARAEALAQNQEAVIGQQIAEQLPQVVGEAAKAFGSIGQLTVLNGAEGVGQMFSQVLGMGAAAVPMIRNLLAENGARAEAEPEADKKEPRSRAR